MKTVEYITRVESIDFKHTFITSQYVKSRNSVTLIEEKVVLTYFSNKNIIVSSFLELKKLIQNHNENNNIITNLITNYFNENTNSF